MAEGSSVINTPSGPRTHIFHAESAALHGVLDRPLNQVVPPQSYIKLKEHGGYQSLDSDRYRLEGLISYSAAYGQVAGDIDTKAGHGWVTLGTSVIENLNILEVITADRVVAQISTEHPAEGYVPKISFLGSRFENLRIAGQHIDVTIDPYVLWDEEEELQKRERTGEEPWHRFRDFQRLDCAAGLHDADLQNHPIPDDLPTAYPKMEHPTEAEKRDPGLIHCSIVRDNQDRSNWHSFLTRHKAPYIFDVPHFGKIYLGLVRLEQDHFVDGIPHETRVSLSMIKVKLGCTASASGSFCSSRLNAGTKP